MKKVAAILALAAILAQLTACGSKGPLSLPEQKPADSQKTTK